MKRRKILNANFERKFWTQIFVGISSDLIRWYEARDRLEENMRGIGRNKLEMEMPVKAAIAVGKKSYVPLMMMTATAASAVTASGAKTT